MQSVSGASAYRQDLERVNARNLFGEGKWTEAGDLFESLNVTLTTYSALNDLEAATCYFLAGQKSRALELFQSATRIIEQNNLGDLEKNALSWAGGREMRKPFRGAPYEQSSAFLLLGILLLDQGDIDNAMAAFKNAQLHDADVTQSSYQADYALPMALESACHRLRKEGDMAEKLKQAAIDSYRLTHPAVRNFVALQAAQEAAGGSTSIQDAELVQQTINNISGKIPESYLDPIFKQKFNVLILISNGKGPVARRGGEHEEFLYLETSAAAANRFEISVDQTDCSPVINGLADINYQATTRGGRMMDDILGQKSETKGYLDTHGGFLMDAARNMAGTDAAKVVVSLGFLMYNAGLFINPESDYRYWSTLPAEFQVAPMQLAPGKHLLTMRSFLDFYPLGTQTFEINVEPAKSINTFMIAVAGTEKTR